MGRTDSRNDIDERLGFLVRRLEKEVAKLSIILETLAVSRISTIRAELKLANHDRAELRKELLLLHSLLNEEVKDMQPKIKHGKLVGP